MAKEIESINESTFKISYDKDNEVEIGDKEKNYFIPHAKIKRWGDECFFNIELPTTKKITPAQDGKKLKWIDTDKEVHLYSLKPNEQMEDGGFEYEVILKGKPERNIIELKIKSQGLDFWRQPELTQDQKNKGSNRPENVIGSYAVYHKTKKGNQVALGKKNYKTGKAFHIYRPQIEDSNGWKVWGELNIDIEQGILSVKIPQDFINNAVYPIKHATGLTFGLTTKGASSGNISYRTATNLYRSYRRGSSEPGVNGTLDKITAWLKYGSEGEDASDISVFLNIENIATDSHVEVAEIENLNLNVWTSAGREYDFIASDEVLSNINRYILSIVGDSTDLIAGNEIGLFYDTTGGTYTYFEYKSGMAAYTSSKESPWTETEAESTDRYSLYATYTPSPFDAVLKRWTGAAWVKALLKRWTGAAWNDQDDEQLKYYDGADWKDVDASGP